MDEYSAVSFRACKLEHLLNGFLNGVRNVVIAGAGQEGRCWQRLLSTKDIRTSAWLDVDQRKIGRILHGAPVLNPDNLAAGGEKILVAIGVRGAREQFRSLTGPRGLREGFDFICVS
jgi:NADH/NAD ratio-sensing transcriptional regulator Rex